MTEYTQENYEAYCEMICDEFPGVSPSDYDGWVAFNEAIDAAEVDHVD